MKWALCPFFCLWGTLTLLHKQLQALLEPVVSGLGYELLGVESINHGRHETLLRLYIDHSEGIRVEDCQKVSYQVSGVLDVEEPIRGQYTLEVSSPGLDRPLFALEHFTRFIGHQAKIRLQRPLLLDTGLTRRNFNGLLIDVKNNEIMIEIDQMIYCLPYDQIDKAHLVPTL